MNKSLWFGIVIPLAGLLTWSSTGLARPSAAVFGPPAVCIPLDIGSDRTIPDEFSAEFTPQVMVGQMLAVLDSNDRTLVHMETLRRAVWAMTASDERIEQQRQDALGHELLSRLRWRLVEALSADEDVSKAELGRAWFDLAFMQGALHQALRFPSEGGQQAMTRAMQLLEQDAAAQLGCALAMWELEEDNPLAFRPRYAAAFNLEEGADPDLSANLLRVGKRLLGCDDRESILEAISPPLGQH